MTIPDKAKEAIMGWIEDESRNLYADFMRQMPDVTLDGEKVDVASIRVRVEDGFICLDLETKEKNNYAKNNNNNTNRRDERGLSRQLIYSRR